MRLGLVAGQFGPKLEVNYAMLDEAERLGFHSVWTAEAYGNDAITPLCFMAARTQRIKLGTAIMQMSARSRARAST